ncbi:endolytic transglycosylase MltG [Clostridium facile]|uniref:Endolytic murein transglycosylase n=1 Tax=Clostridium facile TaxID=2763035 RepID=A0ABR7IR28_9CLOT|nr:endolytic transglycosylase MltG [Clostridium facile]MBC5787592.1 endolytic transglycosylase MltG [Clostridium facile]
MSEQEKDQQKITEEPVKEQEISTVSASDIQDDTVIFSSTSDKEFLAEKEEKNSIEQPSRKSVKKKKKGKKWTGFLVAGIIIIISIGLAFTILTGFNDVFALSKPAISADIEIPSGATTAQISKLLKEEGIIDQPWLFRFVVKMRGEGSGFQAGVHSFSAKWDYDAIIEELNMVPSENPNVIKITFPEGSTLDEIVRLLETNGVCDGDQFLRALEENSFDFAYQDMLTEEKNDSKYHVMEGYAFPNTYNFFKNEDAESVARKFLQAFDEHMQEANLYEQIKSSEFSLDEVITLASIVQAEAGSIEDMPKIASVLMNRIHNSDQYPKLECDPTKSYAKEISGNLKSEGTSDAIAEAYDTYVTPGLPPGAICNPGIDAIQAVLHPATTDYYYFCANIETKECFYAKTLEEHNQNLKKAGLI